MRQLDDDSKNAVAISERMLMELLDENKDTEYGKKYGFADIHSIAEYQEKVPLTHYDDYAPYIERMIHGGEENLLSASPTMHYALSSGSVGVPKHIPVSQTGLDVYSKYATALMYAVCDEYYRNTTGRSMRHGLLFNAIELKLLFALERRDITAMVAAFMTALVDLMDYLKANWDRLCNDISRGAIDPEVRMPRELREDLTARLTPNRSQSRRTPPGIREGL